MKELNIAKLHFDALKRNMRPLNKLHGQLQRKMDRLIEQEAPEKELRALESQITRIERFYDRVAEYSIKCESFGIHNPTI